MWRFPPLFLSVDALAKSDSENVWTPQPELWQCSFRPAKHGAAASAFRVGACFLFFREARLLGLLKPRRP